MLAQPVPRRIHMPYRRTAARWLPLVLTAALLVAALAPAKDAPPARPQAAAAAAAQDRLDFIRFEDDGEGGGTLDTAVATYENPDGVVVHLVAAVHVGEKAYFQGLSDTFDTYDALLYELVKPRGGAVPDANGAARPGGGGGTRVRGGGAIGGLQMMLKDVLELEFQLEAINYDRPNFVHADLDAETFNEMQEARGESVFRLMLRSMMSEMRRQRNGKAGGQQITLFDLLAAMTSPDSARQYKLLLARQMKDVEAQIDGIEGKDGSVIISERNKAALKVLDETIAAGKKNIGVFYGAGHMRGLEDALLDDMGFTRTGVEWRVAWDMRSPGKGAEVPAPAEPQ
jgi:hypothetical protein